MTSLKKALLFGFLIWLIPFAAAFLLFPIHDSNRPLFESIMPVVVTAVTVLFGYKYLKESQNPQKEALKLGLFWFGISIVIDLPLFLPPTPMQMGIWQYIQDIGLTYLIIPLVVMGLGYASTIRK